MVYWIIYFSGLLICLLLIPIVREISIRIGKVAVPREDRWHRKATPTLGGIAIFISFVIGVLVGLFLLLQEFQILSRISLTQINWGFLAGSIFIFGLGVYDDFKRLSPQAKLIGQIIAATIVISLGFTTQFFTPRIANPILAQLPNILLTIFWLVGITNAVNLLDNMDGLAGSISLITAGFLGFLFWQAGNYGLLIITVALAGALSGFLYFNFPPAKIFMGDSGSMFLGFTLAVLAIVRQPQASNVFAILGVPTLLFLLPIVDTVFVSITRILRGQSPVIGGRDHTSHRLIAFGLNERQTLLVLSGIAILSGLAALAIETVGYWLSLVFVPVLVITLALVIAYLAGSNVRGNEKFHSDMNATYIDSNRFVRALLNLTYRRRILEVLLDLLIILSTFYLAFITRYGLFLNEFRLGIFLQSLPFALAGAYISFFYFGIYRAVWRYVGLEELVRYAKASFGASALVGMAIILAFIFRGGQNPIFTEAYSPQVFILFGIYLFLGLTISRSSFRLLDLFSRYPGRMIEHRVLIIGAGDAGEIALRWISMRPEMKYKPIGFLDRNPYMVGRKIHGVDVLGRPEQLDDIIAEKDIQGVIVADIDHASQATSENRDSDDSIAPIEAICRRRGCWMRVLRLEFVLVD